MIFSSTGDRATRLLVIAFAILLVNSSYLAANASPTLFYFGDIALRILFGGALGVIFAGYVIKRFKTFSWPLRAASILLLAGAAFGAYITKVGATRRRGEADASLKFSFEGDCDAEKIHRFRSRSSFDDAAARRLRTNAVRG